MLNSADYNSFFDIVSVYLKVHVFDHSTWNFLYFGGIKQVLNSDFLKFRIYEILNFHPWNLFIIVNSAGPDEMSHIAAFHLGLHYLPKYPYMVFQYTKG